MTDIFKNHLFQINSLCELLKKKEENLILLRVTGIDWKSEKSNSIQQCSIDMLNAFFQEMDSEIPITDDMDLEQFVYDTMHSTSRKEGLGSTRDDGENSIDDSALSVSSFGTHTCSELDITTPHNFHSFPIERVRLDWRYIYINIFMIIYMSVMENYEFTRVEKNG